MNDINGIILAAGKGERMLSSKPKALQMLAGKTLLEHVLIKAFQVCTKVYVIYGFKGIQLKKYIDNSIDVNNINVGNIKWIEQAEQLGTGHAVAQVMPYIKNKSTSVILYSDVPLISKNTLNNLIKKSADNGFAILSVILNNPKGYGRIIRDNNQQIKAIIEHKDANEEELKIHEINTGIIAINSALLKKYIDNLNADNSQNELYLTDIVKLATNDNINISSVIANNTYEVAGINNKVQLAQLERILQKNKANKFMQQGLTLKDANRFDCRGSLTFKKDCEIDINVILDGEVKLGNNVTIAANCSIKNSKIGDNVIIMENSIIRDSVIGDNSSVGPFAHIRPQTHIKTNTKIGSFVEIKKSIVDANSKIPHLSYIGDAIIGKNVNIGAGTITCNYDGVNKHQTKINDGAFIGSNSQLVAPVTIGKNSTIGAGSTITKDAAPEQLTLSKRQQITIKNWQRHSKNKKDN